MKRKRRPVHQFVYVVAALTAGLVPTLAFVTVSYFQEIRETQTTLQQVVTHAVERAERLLTDAEVKLTRFIAVSEGRVTPESVKLLNQLVYNDPRFREAGIIDEGGYLIHTTVRSLDAPIEVAPEKRSNPKVRSLQVIGPLKTKVMRERSIVLALPTQGSGEVNLLVDPKILKHFLDGIELGPSGHVRFLSAAGTPLASLGTTPVTSADGITASDSEHLHFEGATTNGLIRVTADVPKAWVLRGWYHNLKLAIPVTAGCTGLLMFFVLRIMFRPSGLLDHDLRLGLKRNQLQVQYQPIVDLQTGRCIGVEALTRWRHPDYGDVRPKAYVALAEQTGLISELTEWMLRRVVFEQEALLKRHQSLYIAINCAASLLNSADVERIIRRVLGPSAIAPSRVVLEVTEGVFLGDSTGAARETMQRLRQAGFRFALDDFGTGYSGLSYLDQFEFDYLKIDRSFTQSIGQENAVPAILDAVIELGRRLNLVMVAEGVETHQQRRYFEERGVRLAQGWLFSSALSVSELSAFLSRDHTLAP